MRRRIGYAKLGRSMPLRLENCGSLGGDHEMVPTLKLLAERHPDVDFVLVGRNSGEDPRDVGLPSNVYNPWIFWAPAIRRRLNEDGLNYPNLSVADQIRVRDILLPITRDAFLELDGVVMWLGQHGTSNTPLPSIRDRSKLTKPYDWATLYGGYLLAGINAWRDPDPWTREEVLLNADARNYVKYRDAKWPWRYPVLGQYRQVNNVKHERYGDPDVSTGEAHGWSAVSDNGIWTSKLHTAYARLELSSLTPGTPFGDMFKFNPSWEGRQRFGIVVNETRKQVNPAKTRLRAIQDWVLPLGPDWMHGHWTDSSLRALGLQLFPVPLADYPSRMQRVHSTLTTPASGSGWATAKAWESFALGVVCFFHPFYDDQNHILSDAPSELRDFLRVKTPKELARRVDMVHQDRETWEWVVKMQREHFERAVAELRWLKLIEKRLGL